MKNKRTIIIVTAIVVAIVAAMSIYKYKSKNKLDVIYRDVTVKRSEMKVTILSTGIVQPENRLEIKSPIPGRVETILVVEGQRVKKGQVLAWMSSTERAALLDAAASKGPDELKRWQELYQPTPILAPITGSIILRNVESGQTFTVSDSVFVMSDRLTIKAQVDETDIGQIKLKQKAKIILDAYPGEIIDANVDKIAYDAKTVNNVTTYIVDVLPEETPKTMRSGMTANVTFLVASNVNTLVIPSDALRVLDGKFSVLMKTKEGEKPLEKEVKVGLTDGKRTEILEGLSEGDVILAAEIKAIGKNPSASGANPFSPMGAPRRGSGGGH